MTASEVKKKEKQRHTQITALFGSIAFTALIFLTAIFFSDELSDYVAAGLAISVRVIVPSVFPFLLLTDLTVRYIRFERIGGVRRIFERCFRINGAALPVFVCGILCGFPLGAKLAITMYENGKISKCECERLMAFANNASPGYVICAVGIGMRGSLGDGVLLYISAVISSILTGMLLGIKKDKSDSSHFISWQKYSFTHSVTSAVNVCLNISGFVTVFSIAVGVVSELIGSEIARMLIIPIMEIGNAALYLSDLYVVPAWATLALTAFSTSFSGLCVCAQTLSLINEKTNISMAAYIPRKLLQGFIAALLITFFTIIKGFWR